MMPSFTADCYGAKNVGANYGIVFTAWGVCGLTVRKYFAGILKAAKEAGNLAAGYNKAYFTLAVFCVVGIVLVLAVKRPIHEVGPSGGTEQDETRVT
jgi:OFA family oxalate/formate antiporter-like MFS transporter